MFRTLLHFWISCTLDSGREPGPLLRFLIARNRSAKAFYERSRSLGERLSHESRASGTMLLLQSPQLRPSFLSRHFTRSRRSDILLGTLGSALIVVLLGILAHSLSGSVGTSAFAAESEPVVLGQFSPDLRDDLLELFAR